MAVKSLSKMLEKREALDKRINDLMRERAELDRQIFPRVKKLAAAVDGEASAKPELSEKEIEELYRPTPVVVHVIKQRPKQLVSEIEKVLKEANHPMKTGDILLALQAKNVEVNGKNPLNNLAAHLSHHNKHFARIGEGWVLTSNLIEVNANAHAQH
jgi:hypothetical protein